MESKVLSIIIPVYNAEKYIPNLMEKFVVQDLSNVEIILVDDGSKDNSLRICQEYADRNENIVVIPLNDMIGIQVASAVKNVFAIFCGYADAKGYSDSLKAALLSKLIKDMRLLIKYFGGNDDTLFEYAGLGDMLLTCMSSKSRNYTFGKMLGSGYKYDNILKKMNVTTVEGISTLNILHKMLVQKNVKVKSINTLYDIIYNGYEINNILKDI